MRHLIILIITIGIFNIVKPREPREPVIHCYKQTINTASMLHRIKCPGEG